MRESNLKITKRVVDGLQRGDGKDTFLWDSELRGFGVRCRPSGAKFYFVQTRVGRRQRWLTIGRHGSPWAPETARKEAKRLLGEIAAGTDPGAQRDAEKAAGTVAELCELYLAEGCVTKKDTTLFNDRSRIERHIKPLLGPLRVRDVNHGDVERFQRDVAEGRTAADIKTGRGRSIVTGGKGAARLSTALLSAIFSFAVRRKLRADNPCSGVAKFNAGTRERFLSAAEQVRLGEALARAEAAGVRSAPITIIRLLALTGARLSEIRALRWSEIDFERGCLRLPDSKTGAKVIPLGAAALELLCGIDRRSNWVFPSDIRIGSPISDISYVWEPVRRAAGLADVRLHDLRHSFASTIVNAGGSLPLIGALLGHKNIATTQRYSHLAADPLREVANRAAGSIAAALSGNPSAEIVPLKKHG